MHPPGRTALIEACLRVKRGQFIDRPAAVEIIGVLIPYTKDVGALDAKSQVMACSRHNFRDFKRHLQDLVRNLRARVLAFSIITSSNRRRYIGCPIYANLKAPATAPAQMETHPQFWHNTYTHACMHVHALSHACTPFEWRARTRDYKELTRDPLPRPQPAPLSICSHLTNART